MKGLLLILFLSVFWSCSKKNKIPKGILSQQEMHLIMWDLIRADEFTGNFMMKDSALDKKLESTRLYEQIFRIHATTKEKFQKSLDFYQSRPDLFKVVMDSLRSNERKAMMDQDKGSKPGMDSIKQRVRPLKTIAK